MQDGLFQLFFILIIVLASIFDAVSRNRKKRERMEEMEREEAEGEVRAERGDEAPVATAERPRDGVLQGDRGGNGRDTGRGQDPSREEETADAMVPDDLWAILTGERRPPKPAPPSRESEEEPLEPVRTGSSPASARRPSHEPAPSAGSSSGPRSPWGRRPPSPAPPRTPVPLPPPVEVPGEGEVYQEIEEPWANLPDITEGEIGFDERPRERESEPGGRGAPRPRWGKRARVEANPHTRLLVSGRREDLRSAIVLSEVLGTPVGLRGSSVSPAGGGPVPERPER